MTEHKKIPEPVEALVLILVVFAALILSVLIFSVFNQSDIEQAEELLAGSRIFYIFGGSLFLIIPLIYAYKKKYPIKPLFRLNPVPLPVVIVTILIGLALTVIGDELDRIIAMLITIPDWIYEMMYPLKAESFFDWILIFCGAVVVASVAEEFLFRGFLQVTLENKGDVTRAVLLSSVTWTLVHQNPYWAAEIFILGVFIGYLAWRTNSIFPPIIAHAVNNFIGVYIYNLEDAENALHWYEWNGHVAPYILVIAIGVLVLGIRWLSAQYQADS